MKAPTKDELIYLKYMSDVRARIDFLQRFDLTSIPKQAAVESIALHLRKLAEMVIFASLVINRKQYAQLHSDFEKHWRIKSIIKEIKKINPHYLPMPIREYEANGQRRWEYPTGVEYLSEDELIEIYEESSNLIHSDMPFSESTTNIDDYLSKVNSRIATFVRTLNHHRIIPPEGEEYFVVQMLVVGHDGPVIYTVSNQGPGLLRDGKELKGAVTVKR